MARASARRGREEAPPPRFTEEWLAAVMSDRTLSPRAKVVAYVLARHGDWYTGRDCWPSAPTIAKDAGVSEVSVRRGLHELETAGYVERTGVHRPKNATDWRLVVPASLVNGDQTSVVNGDQTGDRQSGQNRPSVWSETAVSLVNGDQQPHTSSRPLGSEEGGGGASAPAPDGSDAPRPTDADNAVAVATPMVRALLPRILPATFASQEVIASDRKLVAAVVALLTDGWTEDNIRAACAHLRTPKSNPTAYLAKHLSDHLVGTPPPVVVTIPAPPPAGAKPAAPHPFDQANERDLDAFLRAIGANRAALHDAIAAMLADGLSVTVDLSGRFFGEHTLDVTDERQEDDLGWSVQWRHAEGEPQTLSADLTGYSDDVLANLCWRINNTGDPGGGGDGTNSQGWTARFESGRLAITPRLFNVNHFTKLVALTRRADVFADQLTAAEEARR